MGARWQKSSVGANLSASQLSRDGQIAVIAARQHQLITTRQLAELGFSRGGIHERVAQRRLHRVHHGVYSLLPPPHDRHRRWLAAVLACGPGALLAGISSAELQGFADTSSLTAHVAFPGGSGRSREGVFVHRRPVDPRDVRRRDGVPCTSADRVLVDLAPHRTEPELEVLLVAAESLRLIKRPRLAELVAERRGRPGMARLAALLELEPAFVRSELELLFLPICREAGVERPLVNHPIEAEDRTLIVDFAWPELRMVVEADSQRFHGDWVRAEADRERDQQVTLVGWRPHRFARRRLAEDPSGAAERLRSLAAARAKELSHAPE